MTMQKAFATYRSSRLELDGPVDWPEGTRLEVRPTKGAPRRKSRNLTRPSQTSFIEALQSQDPDRIGLDESQWPQTRAEMEAWEKWFDSPEPVMTPEEQVAFDEHLRTSKEVQKELTKKNWEELEKLF
jgi:hypothetical protein